ncbi:S9 family peptidase [Vibrio harveyi]|nr:S9 family peptidase [Vibrio harveyi]
MKSTCLRLLASACILSSGSAFADTSDMAKLFAKGSSFFNPKLSPDGKYLGVESKVDGKDALVILDAQTMKPTNMLRFPDNEQVADYYWVNNERVVASKETFTGWFTQPSPTGEFVAANVDGSKTAYLFGPQPPQSGSSVSKRGKATRAFGIMLDPMPNDKKHMLIAAIPYNRSFDMEEEKDVYKVNVYNGRATKQMSAPIRNSYFLVNHDNQVGFVTGSGDDLKLKSFYRNGNKWQSIATLDKLNLEELTPISFAENNHSIYAAASKDGSPQAIYHVDLKTGKYKEVVAGEKVSPHNFWLDQQSKQLYAIEYEKDYPTYAFVDDKHPLSKQLKQLLATFEGHQVRILSQTENGDKFIALAFNDRNPGDYYLFNTDPVEGRYLFSAQKWHDPKKMAEVRPFAFTARDGQEINALLTLPPGKTEKDLPLIVNPHGGPHGPRDWWEFNPENQFLAQKGYAVLQINFRGSGGFGDNFEELGYRKWGTNIQYDIIDATRHIIKQGIADADRICISGGSFGGYSALQSAIVEPDLFQCAVGSFGVYDLEMLYTEGDVKDRKSGVNYLEEVIGRDKKELQSMSPVHHVDKLKADIMLVHGAKDERAPIEQFDALVEALKAINYPHKTMVIGDEGHGFYNDEHQAKYLTQIGEFFDKHLKN